MDIEDSFSKVIGGFGKFQFQTYALLTIGLVFLTSHTFLVVFVGVKPSDLQVVNSRVEESSSILIEWDLLDRLWISDLIQTLYFAGNLAGVVSFGQLSDVYGRRQTLKFILSCLLPICFLISYVTTWQAFAIMRFLIGFLQGSAGLVLFVYMQEIAGREWWAITGAYINILFAIGIPVLSIFAFYIPSWRDLTRAVSLFQLIPLVYIMFLPESPRWLYSVGKVNEAEHVLMFMAKKNGVRNPKISLAEKATHSRNLQSSYTIKDLFKHKATAKRILLMIVIWFANSFVYFAMTLAAGNIGTNVYVSSSLSGLIELPSTILCTIMIEKKRFGRKKTLIFFMLSGGISCFALLNMSNSQYSLLFGLIGKMMIAASFSAVYVYTPELFPTSVRNVALGACSMSARFGGMIASSTNSINPKVSYGMFGLSCLFASLLTTRLPETYGIKPPDSFEDLSLSTTSAVEKRPPNELF